MPDIHTAVSEIIPQTRGVKSFRFVLDPRPAFAAGQYMLVTIRVQEQEQAKPFTISNSPTEDGYVEFTKKITDSPYSRVLDAFQGGEPAGLDLPKGSFTLDPGHEKVAFLSGGIGITPIRSICKDAVDRDVRTDIVLLYGNHAEQDILFRPELDEWQSRHEGLRVVHTLDAVDPKSEWPGRTGYIDAGMIRAEIPDYQERTFYVCGPPAMVKNMIGILKGQLGLDQTRIRQENFMGY